MARRIVLAASFLLCFWVSSPVFPQQAATVTVAPSRVVIGLFYGGQQVSVRAALPEDCDVVVRVSGSSQDLKLKRKGRQAGILWMNVGEVEYRAVPSLLMVRSSRPLENLCSIKALEELGLGYQALESRAVPTDEPDAKRLFGEMVRLKEREGLYSSKPEGIRFSPLGQGFHEASASFFLPPKAPPGNYSVDVFAFRHGQGTLVGSGSFDLDFSPPTAFISHMARNHGFLYGCLAAIIAILAGLATGFVFGGKGEAH